MEAEWEDACRAGTNTRFFSGNTEADLARVAWYFGQHNSSTHPVGQKEPNALGLYDMHGNVWQWCQDFDPQGPEHGKWKVLRGGAWSTSVEWCRSAQCWQTDDLSSKTYEKGDVGFRVVVPVP